MESKSFEIEGIGYDFVPTVLDQTLASGWDKCDDAESFLMARRLIKEEGLLCGKMLPVCLYISYFIHFYVIVQNLMTIFCKLYISAFSRCIAAF